ncbi:hypothetical protein BU23DRAFT_600530 [Bimuria novae-zelandiae CBS 107.79]|uniref:F-box domain-containing protein n=1 Tax=Bimuria novae-zelandiae CBS 107.79 TaxID=1447943 RepID=A0A6A5V2R0_9PLEO|nr:hypothetical protein BU23DRAFT_600530 [Bimuria novae-zelandiae CBS 107.79]
MVHLILDQFPAELLQRIAVKLSSREALTFILTCRSIHSACDDWTVWRDLLAMSHILGGSYDVILQSDMKQNWKKYVLADALAGQKTPLKREDIEHWLPHMIVMLHPLALSSDTAVIHQLCDFICNISIVFDHGTNPPSQGAPSFCLTSQLLTNYTSSTASKRPRRLRFVQWLRLTYHNGDSIRPQDNLVHHLAMLHTLANRAVGFFYVELIWALENNCNNTRPAGVMYPPTISTLPTPSHQPPAPFSSAGLEAFSTCHLSKMTDPTFFMDDEWKGFDCANGDTFCFYGIGADNDEVIVNRLDVGPNHNYPFRVDRFIQFQLVREWENGERYLLQSNVFQTQASFHMLQIEINRTNGHLKIEYRFPLLSFYAVMDAVITPFVIVLPVGANGLWYWYWKVKWSGRNPDVYGI